MLIYDRFVFLHMPKTVGIFVTDALRDEFGPPVEMLDTHAGWDAIPPAAAGRPVLMFVRNPWDWYVSWYHFWTGPWLRAQSARTLRDDPWVRLLFGDGLELGDGGELRGVPGFAATLRGACSNLVPDHPVMAEMIAAGEPHVAAIEPGEGFYTARFKQMAGAGLGSDQLTIGRFESLLDDLERFLADSANPLGHDAARRIASRSPVNSNPHRPYREYYDDELRDLVARSCRSLIEDFDYRF